MKYRIKRLAKRWTVQKCEPRLLATNKWVMWQTVAKWRWHWCAAIHLLWLRERARGQSGYKGRFL